MKKRIIHKRHTLFFITGAIATSLVIMTPYNWWLIAMIIVLFLFIAMMTKSNKEKKKEL
jgi:uncharacterized membrane protein YoaK (UPF0700 family)